MPTFSRTTELRDTQVTCVNDTEAEADGTTDSEVADGDTVGAGNVGPSFVVQPGNSCSCCYNRSPAVWPECRCEAYCAPL